MFMTNFRPCCRKTPYRLALGYLSRTLALLFRPARVESGRASALQSCECKANQESLARHPFNSFCWRLRVYIADPFSLRTCCLMTPNMAFGVSNSFKRCLFSSQTKAFESTDLSQGHREDILEAASADRKQL